VVKRISIWYYWLDEKNPGASGKLLKDAGMDVVSLVRGVFFSRGMTEEKQKAIVEHKNHRWCRCYWGTIGGFWSSSWSFPYRFLHPDYGRNRIEM